MTSFILNDCMYLQTFTHVWVNTVKCLNGHPKLFCNLPLIQTKSSNLWVFRQKDANGIANSGDPDQIAPLSGSELFAQTYLSENLGSLQ